MSNESPEYDTMATTNEPAVRSDDTVMDVNDATVTFDSDHGKSKVLDGADIDIQRHEFLGIVGESGSGKSMFASALLDAVVEPGVLTGDITYHPPDGNPVDVLNLSTEELRQLRWEEIAMVFQGAMSSFNPTMEIRDHFELTLEAHDHDLDEGMEQARELLEDLYLEPDRVLDSYPHELSGGMKQRALIALSLVLKPNVLVMDEPTAALDLLMQQSILQLLEDLQKKYDLTIVFITHDLPLVAGLADRLVVMYAFDFVEMGPTEEIVKDPSHPYTRALLKSVPNLDSPLSTMEPIEGSGPHPANTPSGCSYHPRCPLADEQCRQEEPEYHQVKENNQVACFHWEDAADAVTLDAGSADDEPADTADTIAADHNEKLLSLSDLTVHFDKQEEGFWNLFSEPDTVHAVDDVNLDIYENDVVVLVGESGCGKTTLGKTAIGIQRPTSGSVTYRDQDIWQSRDEEGEVNIPFEEIRKSLQIIHQDPGSSLNPNRTVKSSLTMPLKRWRPDMGQDDREEQVMTMLEYVGMSPPDDYANRYPHQLSGGEKQRVALIRALLMNPDLILADEAVSALDVSLRVDMMDLMLELQEMFNTSYLFISHNLSNARYLANKAGGRIGVMYMGEIVEIGPAEQIINDPQHPYTKVLKWSTSDLKLEERDEELPIRSVDIPDSTAPPSGCRFHTRCPEAREACKTETPELDEESTHQTACFRTRDEGHEYWQSDPLPGVNSSPKEIDE